MKARSLSVYPLLDRTSHPPSAAGPAKCVRHPSAFTSWPLRWLHNSLKDFDMCVCVHHKQRVDLELNFQNLNVTWTSFSLLHILLWGKCYALFLAGHGQRRPVWLNISVLEREVCEQQHGTRLTPTLLCAGLSSGESCMVRNGAVGLLWTTLNTRCLLGNAIEEILTSSGSDQQWLLNVLCPKPLDVC